MLDNTPPYARVWWWCERIRLVTSGWWPMSFLTRGPSPPRVNCIASLQTKLPAHMLPSAFVVLDALPLTPSGKVDRRALPAPDQVRPELGGAFIAPRTPVEEVLAGIWADVLRLEEVGVHDNFFELGGHSLLATQIMSRLCRTFQVELPLRTLFATPTVAGLADGLETTGRAKRGLQTPPVLPVSRGGTLPLSFAQERLWFLAQLEPDSSAYHIPAAFRLTGALNVTALERSLNEIVRRHEALRTTLASVDGIPVQIIAENRTVPLPALDLSASPEAEREAAVRHLNAEAQRPFNLAHDLPLRATLLRLGEQEHVLLLVMHHITSDAWSLGVFLRELAVLYGTFSAGEPSPLPELSVQYADYAVWQRQQLQGVALDHHRLTGAASWPACTRWRCPLIGHGGPSDPSGGTALLRALPDAHRGAPCSEPAGRGHLVHDLAGGAPNPAPPLYRGGRHCGGRAHCRAHAGGDRGADPAALSTLGAAH